MIDLRTYLVTEDNKEPQSDLNEITDNENTQETAQLKNESMSLSEFVENYYDVNDYYDTFISRTYNI